MGYQYLKRHSPTEKPLTPPTDKVRSVIDDVRENGDAAVRKYSTKLDNWDPPAFKLSQTEVDAAIGACPKQMIEDIRAVQANVRTFAEAQKNSIKDFEMETQPGLFLGQKSIPVGRAGAYIPGGRYPLLASAHMTILTAKVAGVKHVIGCTPPIGGKVPQSTIAAMHLAGADEIFILGGTQAIAAMGLGTETIQKVDFIAGPGNAFVAEAKKQLFGEVGIDLIAGPTEILIVADETADPFTIATDILSQAEHGPGSPAVLITTSGRVGRKSMEIIDELLKELPTADMAGQSWRAYGEVIVLDSLEEAWELADEYAIEHVQIFTKQPREALEKMTTYGALFLGEMTCVSYGDKVAGPNHVLPTGKSARYTGGLWVGKFLRTVTFQEIKNSKTSGELGRLCGRSSRAEKFEGHARSADLRAHKYLDDGFEWIKSYKEAATN